MWPGVCLYHYLSGGCWASLSLSVYICTETVHEPKIPPSSISQTAPPEPGQHALFLVIPEPQTDPLTTLDPLL